MKKLISAAVAAAMALTALPAFAAEAVVEPGTTQYAGAATDKEAIAVAKLTFDIPEELSECDYQVYDRGGEQGFDINWYDPQYEKSINVEINSRLVPVRYYDYTGEEQRGLSELRKSQLLENARAFLKKTVPQLADKLVYNEDESAGVRFYFNRFENGVRVEGSYASIYVDRVSGKVRRYNLTWDFDSDFSATGGIDADKAYEVLNSEGVSTMYQVFGDKAFPVYMYDINVYVDSFGRTFTPAPGNVYFEGDLINAEANEMSTADSGASGGGSYRLTEQEAAAVKQMNSLISREKIEEIIASMPELSLPEKYDLVLRYYSQRSADLKDEKVSYTVNCEFETESGYAELVLNAETGEVKSFYSWNEADMRYSDDEPRAYSEEQCRSIGEGFIGRIKNLDGYRLEAERGGNGAHYVRYIGEIPFPSDYRGATVSSNTGKIVQYYEYTPDVEIVTPATMTDRLAAVKDNYDAEPVYTYMTDTDDEGNVTGVHPVLARKLTCKSYFYAIKAEDGQPVDYDGEKPQSAVIKSDETDHPAWNAFDILRENDVTLYGSWSFNDGITKADFRTLLDMLRSIDAVPYRYAFYEENEADMNTVVTREEGARMVAEQLGWDRLIDLDIYSVPFATEASFEGGVGAAAILYGLGVMSADERGNFRPGESLTYGDAFIIAYNLAKLDL